MAEAMLVRANGLDCRVQERGAGDPLVLLHGFTGSSGSWFPIDNDLARDFRVIAIDLIGHGASEAPDDSTRYAFEQTIDDLAAIADHLGITRAHWLGYSMGGRLALGLALEHPRLVSALVLESATAGIRSESERAERRAADEALARRIEAIGIAAFVAEWERLPLWESQHRLDPGIRRRQRELRLRNRSTGLANSLRGMGQGAQPSLWERLADIETPVLLVAGALDAKFAAIAAQLDAALPRAETLIVPDAGHAVHLERPGQFVDAVRAFLARRAHLAIAERQETHA